MPSPLLLLPATVKGLKWTVRMLQKVHTEQSKGMAASLKGAECQRRTEAHLLSKLLSQGVQAGIKGATVVQVL